MTEMCAWCGRPLPPDGYMSLKGKDQGKKVHFFNPPPGCRPPVPAKKAPKKPREAAQ